jgi:hypothetical protein
MRAPEQVTAPERMTAPTWTRGCRRAETTPRAQADTAARVRMGSRRNAAARAGGAPTWDADARRTGLQRRMWTSCCRSLPPPGWCRAAARGSRRSRRTAARAGHDQAGARERRRAASVGGRAETDAAARKRRRPRRPETAARADAGRAGGAGRSEGVARSPRGIRRRHAQVEATARNRRRPRERMPGARGGRRSEGVARSPRGIRRRRAENGDASGNRIRPRTLSRPRKRNQLVDHEVYAHVACRYRALARHTASAEADGVARRTMSRGSGLPNFAVVTRGLHLRRGPHSTVS